MSEGEFTLPLSQLLQISKALKSQVTASVIAGYC